MYHGQTMRANEQIEARECPERSGVVGVVIRHRQGPTNVVELVPDTQSCMTCVDTDRSRYSLCCVVLPPVYEVPSAACCVLPIVRHLPFRLRSRALVVSWDHLH